MTGRYRNFDAYQVGEKGETVPRTISEADITAFACLTGDYSRIHMDRHYAAQTPYEDRIAHGLLGASLATGMLSLDAPHILGRGNPKAYFYGLEVNYRDVIRLGDTIKTKWQVSEKAPDQRHEGFGAVKTAFHVVNQEGIPVYDGAVTIRVGIKEPDVLQLEPGAPWELPESAPDTERLCYAEDYSADGQAGETEGRTITETDIVNFAGLTGDYNPQHVDSEFAGKSMFGERIAHGMLSFNISFAYWLRDWLPELSRFSVPKSNIAGHLNDTIRFLAPVKINDTIRCRYKTLSARVSKSRPGLGLVTFGLHVINQRDEVVQEGSVIMMMPSMNNQPYQTETY